MEVNKMTAEEYVVEDLKRTKEELCETQKMLAIYKEQAVELAKFQDEVMDFFRKNKIYLFDDHFYLTGYENCYKDNSPRLYEFIRTRCYVPKLDEEIKNLTYETYCGLVNAMGLGVRSTACLIRFYYNQDRPEFHSYREMLEWLKETDNLVKIKNIQKGGAKEVSEKAVALLNEEK